MLHSVRLQNFRSFEDTNTIELRKLNVLIGANNAGKTSFLSAVELFLRSLKGAGGRGGPLAFDEMASFASFDSVLRRHWSPSEQRPHEFVLSCSMKSGKQPEIGYEFTCSGQPKDNTSYVSRAAYRVGESKLIARFERMSKNKNQYQIRVDNRTIALIEPLFFHSLVPLSLYSKRPKLIRSLLSTHRPVDLEVVNPYRPVPRSFYVLDDPSLALEDRELLAFLLRIWSADDERQRRVRDRVVSNLQTLGLARQFGIAQVSKRFGPKVIEIRVAPTILRHRVTIADAGFGLSQALPLVAYDARLIKGYFIAYQPEVHLHPFAQSRLADIFAGSVGRGNQLFIETHSPDLILRLQAKVARKELSARDVRIFCFENRRGRSQIMSVDFNGKGSPTMPWPSGFLDTSLNLARELVSERQKRGKNVS